MLALRLFLGVIEVEFEAGEVLGLVARFPAASRSMRNHLRRLGYKVNRKRVQRLMRLMGLEAIYPKRKTSRPHPAHKVYPYLLRNLKIDRPNQV
jgi:transposase InsO family protein